MGRWVSTARTVKLFLPPFQVGSWVFNFVIPVTFKARSSQRFGMPSPPQRITATGGASANQSILNSRVSIFGGDVRTKTWSPAFAFTSFSYSGFSELDSSPDGCENLVLS